MKAGQIVLVNWRDALQGTGEPNKIRPGIVVSDNRLLESGVRFAIIVPLSGSSRRELASSSLHISPTRENGCTKESYALSYLVQSVPNVRITETNSRVTADQLQEIRAQIAACVGVA